MNSRRAQGTPLVTRLLYLLAALSIIGCAGASVTPEQTSVPISTSRPSTIFVYDFAVSLQEVTLNQGFFQREYRQYSDANLTKEQNQLADQTAQQLSFAIVGKLQKMGFYAIRLPRGTPPNGNNVLIVDGQFLDLSEGNRLRRMVIGLGSGQSVVDTQVQLYQLNDGVNKQLDDFKVHSDSGEMPGVALTAPAGAAAGGAAAAASLGANLAAGAGKTYTSAMGTLTLRSADKTAAYLSQYFANQGWIAAPISGSGL
jgi:Domain of unknown function (DUF4410)